MGTQRFDALLGGFFQSHAADNHRSGVVDPKAFTRLFNVE
jgi:hypothetical protein